jgi:hypothetical protein
MATSGSPMWKEAQQEVRQQWFIDSYMTTYIQVLYRVTGVHPTGLTVDQGCVQVSTKGQKIPTSRNKCQLLLGLKNRTGSSDSAKRRQPDSVVTVPEPPPPRKCGHDAGQRAVAGWLRGEAETGTSAASGPGCPAVRGNRAAAGDASDAEGEAACDTRRRGCEADN